MVVMRKLAYSKVMAIATFAIVALLTAGRVQGAIGIDANVSKNQGTAATSVTTPSFSTTAGNELLLAFISTDAVSSPNITVTGVTGAGLTWVLVRRTNAQLGTAEIWRAFSANVLTGVTVSATLSQSVDSSMTVLSFTGVDSSGTNGSGAIGATGSGNASSGAPTASLVTTRGGSLVLGVGNDWDSPTRRTVGSGQTLVHQYLPPVGDTYWVQMESSTTPASGTTVTINDTAPTTDRYNLTIVEVLASAGAGGSTFGISGAITPSANGSGASVALSQNGTTIATTTADGTGSYTFTGLANGTYAVTPSKSGFAMSPSSQTVTINGSNMTVPNFTATPLTWTISGTITPATSGSGATVALSGAASQTTTADASGNYSFTGLANGSYVVTPTKSGFFFIPSTLSVSVNNADSTGNNFSIQPVPTYSISGTISPATDAAGAIVTLGGNANATTTADASGNYTFAGLTNGSYTVTPSKPGFKFSPASQPVSVSGSNITGVNFTIQATYTISGSITPSTDGAGSTLTLSGTSTATVTADSAGNYSFTGLISGTYTVRPSKSGFTFDPINQLVTLSSADQPGVNFTIQPVPTYSISGTISPAASGSGATVALSGASTATTTADASGNYTFSGLVSGSYAVTPSKAGFSFTPSVQSVNLSGADATGVNFTAQTVQPAALIIDVTPVGNQNTASTTVKTPSFSTNYPNEVLLALIATDAPGFGTNTVVNSVSGAGLTWVLVLRTNAQKGDAEIWRAFAPATLSNVSVTASLSNSVASSITVVSFAGADITGTNGSGAIGATKSASAASGAPSATLSTTRANSWVLGVGNDYDNPIDRTLGPNQTLISEFFPSVGDTYWVQRQNAPTSLSGTNVTINDTAPTGDRYNLSIVEVLPSLTGGSGGAPPTVNMISPAAGQTVTDKTTIAANASSTSFAITGVQFLLDGSNLGPQVTSPPYYMTWDTTAAAAGTHTLAAKAFDSGGNSTTSASISVTVDNSGNPAVVGSWSAPVNIPTVAVNLVLLKNGKLLFYEDGLTPTVWDYNTNVFTNIATSADLFCSGHAVLADGRILVVGGFGGSGTNIGIANAEIFDPATNVWTKVPNMAYKRWYPTATTLSDGRVLVTAGWQTSPHTNAGIPEIYDPASNLWTQLSNANNPFETYPFIFQLPDGRVLHVGGTEYPTITDILDLSTQTWTSLDTRIIDGASATMYLPNEILKAGSATDSQNIGPSSNTAYILDMTQPSPAWQQVPSMAYPRSFMNLTELPDGTVLATGGETDKDGGNIANAVYKAELWSPATKTWTTMGAMHTPREYHSTAVLLPDGRVVESGMGADFGNVPDQLTAEFYSPPYLFKGTRPTITQAPTGIAYGENFFVGTPDGATITSAVLIRTGAVTHFFDQNTRFVPVNFAQTTGGLTVTAPANSNLAPPGYYMLFLVNNNGVPSVAPILQLHP
jgi:hypothetical protein